MSLLKNYRTFCGGRKNLTMVFSRVPILLGERSSALGMHATVH
jgi:hypothetical protein